MKMMLLNSGHSQTKLTSSFVASVMLMVPFILRGSGIDASAFTAETTVVVGSPESSSHCCRTPMTVCVIEERLTIPSQNHSGCVNDVYSLLAPNLHDVKSEVTLVWRVVNPEDFHWTLQSACQDLISTCSGLVASLSSSARTQSFKNWAAEHSIPYVIVAEKPCSVTSSEMTKSLQREHILIKQLLSYLGWTQVAVLVDSSTIDSSATAKVVQQLSDIYMGTLVFRLFEHPHDHLKESEVTFQVTQYVRNHLRLIQESRFKTILVMASPKTAELVLLEAREMKLLSREHYWVIVLPFSHCFDLLRSLGVNRSNILIVHPNTHKGPCVTCFHLTKTCGESPPTQPKPTKMAEALEALVRAAELVNSLEHARYDSENSSVCENSTDARHIRSAVIKELEEYQKKQTQKSSSRTFCICSTAAGREEGLVNVGWWSEISGLRVTGDQLFMNTFRDFGYKTLRVGTQEAKPFVQKIGNTSMFEGFCIDILNELASALKFDYEFVEPLDGEWGAPRDDNSGNWTGIVQLVRAQEVDFGIGPFTITSIREEVIDFTKPFMEDGVGILTKRPDSDAKNMFKMFTPLTPLVWGAVAGAVVVVSASLYLIERFSPFSARNLEGDGTLGLLGSVWLIYGSYMEQGGDPHPRSVSARFLVGFWWLFTILMTSTYTANLAAFLTVTIEESPINSLTELAASSDLKPLVKTGSNVMTLFQEAEGGIYQQIWNKMSDMPVVKSNKGAKQYVEDGNFAYMTDASQLEYIMLKDCTTYSVAKELFNTGGFGFVLQEDSPYMDVINYNIMKMQEAGLMDKWRHYWWSSPDPCTSSHRTSAAKELDWPSLSGLFYIFLAVTAVSVVLRVFEIWSQADWFIIFWNRLKSVIRMASSKDTTISTHHRYVVKTDSGGGYEHSEKHEGQRIQCKRNALHCTESSAARYAFDGPYREEDRRNSENRFSTENERYKMENRSIRSTRSPEFQDFHSENHYWEPKLHRRSSERQSS